MIYLGADHRGFRLKEKVKEWLKCGNLEFEDVGNWEHDLSDDYTTYASNVAEKVAEDKNSFGILFCGSGVGVDIVANKFDNVRASVGKVPLQVEAGRKDDNMNVLVIAADFTKDEEAKEMIKVFLKTKYEKSKRHERRLDVIEKIEESN